MERGIPVELLYALAFIAFVLFNILARRATQRRQAEAQAQAEAPPAAPPDEPLEDIWGRTPAPQPAPAPVIASRTAPALPSAGLPTPRLHPVRALLKDKRDLRRAVILMMVLGPCSAHQGARDRPGDRGDER